MVGCSLLVSVDDLSNRVPDGGSVGVVTAGDPRVFMDGSATDAARVDATDAGPRLCAATFCADFDFLSSVDYGFERYVDPGAILEFSSLSRSPPRAARIMQTAPNTATLAHAMSSLGDHTHVQFALWFEQIEATGNASVLDVIQNTSHHLTLYVNQTQSSLMRTK